MKDKLKQIGGVIGALIMLTVTIITFLIMFKVIPVPEGLGGLVVLKG